MNPIDPETKATPETKVTVESLRTPIAGHFDQIWGAPEYTDWVDESLSWKKSCYLGDWGFLPDRRFKGPDVMKLFADISVNSMKNFEIGQSKHIIHCNPQGKIINEGILSRVGDDELIGFGQNVLWADFMLRKGRYNVSSEPANLTKFHLQGPNALRVLEQVAGQSLRDLRFMRSKTVEIAGHKVIALRQGMSGEIGFELQGPVAHGEEIRAAVMEVGQHFQIRRMGGRVAMLNHLEASYPTVTLDYLPAIFDSWGDSYRASLRAELPKGFFDLFYKVSGSFDSGEVADYYRSPVEFGWSNRIKFDHDFIGREALRAEVSNPRRTVVTLVWDSDDVSDAYRSLFRKAEPMPDYMEMPRERRGYMYADAVHSGDRMVGVSTSRGFSAYFREMLSLCVIDVEYAKPGTAVMVLWGRPGTAQRAIRATVARAPYKEDRGRVDFKTLPA